MLNLFKNFRLLILILLVLSSVFLLTMPYFSRKNGVFISSISEDSKCKNLKTGDIITQISGYQINDVKDFEIALSYLKSEEYVSMVVNNGPNGCVAVKDGYLGISVADLPSKKLKFSIDLQGGYVTKFKSIENVKKIDIEKTIDILNKRIDILGLVETKAYLSDSVINVISNEQIESVFLTKPCEFVGNIEQKIDFKDKTAGITISNETYKIGLVDENAIMINGLRYNVGQRFTLQGITFNIRNVSTNFTQIDGMIITNNDSSRIIGYGNINFDSNSRVYYVTENILVSSGASERFTKLTKSISSVFDGREFILTAPLTFYIDNELIFKSNIPRSMSGKPIQQMSLPIYSNDVNEVLNKKMLVDVCLGSGSLPANIEKFDVEKIESSLSGQTKVFLIVLPIVVLISVIFLNIFYQKGVKIILWGIVLSLMELVVILGIISFAQTLPKYIWVLDIPTILGFITVFSLTLFKMFYLTIYQKSAEQKLNKIKLFLTFLMDKLEVILVSMAFILLFTDLKGFGLTTIVATILWVVLVKKLYLSKFKQS